MYEKNMIFKKNINTIKEKIDVVNKRIFFVYQNLTVPFKAKYLY